MKKLIALLLAMVLLLGMAACGAKQEEPTVDSPKQETPSVDSDKQEVSSEPKEEVTLNLYYANGSGVQEYTDEVEAKLGEILDGMEGYEHINIELNPAPNSSDHQTNLTLAMTNGDPIDIIFTYGLDSTTMANEGDLLELSDLVAKYPDVLSEIPEWLAEMGKINGGRYIIPAYQGAAYYTYFILPTEYANYYREATGKTSEDISAAILDSSVTEKLDFLEELCISVREGSGISTKYINTEIHASPRYMFNAENASLYGGDVQEFIIREGVDEVELWYMTDDYYTIASRLNEWMKEGLVHPDSVTLSANDYRRANQMNEISFVNDYAYNSNNTEDIAASQLSSYGWEAEAYPVKDHAYVPAAWAAGGPAIFADCEHPEEAMMIIELLMTKKGSEFYNTLVRGLEGVHYEWVDKNASTNGRIKTLEYDHWQAPSGVGTHSAYPWAMGNMFNAWVNQANADDYFDKLTALHNSSDTVPSAAVGVTFDVSSVSDQMNQVSAVIAEYKYSWGSDNFEELYAEFMAKLEAAGIHEILDTLNAQLDAAK